MDFRNEIRVLGKDIHQKVMTIVEANMGDDDKLYQGAILKLNDGRNMFVSFNLLHRGEIKIWNYHYDEELQKCSGDSFWISPKSGYGFVVDITLFNADKDDINFSVSDQENSNYVELADEKKDAIKNYITKLYEQIPTLEYDKEATHAVSNLNFDAKQEYNIQRFINEVEKVKEDEQPVKIIPSVQVAVDWWTDMISNSNLGGSLGNDGDSPLHMSLAQEKFSKVTITEEQLAKFESSLARAIMLELSKGQEVNLAVDYNPSGILKDAFVEAGISGCKAPLKTSMFVSVDIVRVCVGLGSKPEDIFNSLTQEETKHI